MENLKSKTCLVRDLGGLQVELALKLAESFGRVYYNTVWQSPFPKRSASAVGEGLEKFGVYRVNYFWEYKDLSDLIVYTDTSLYDEIEELKKQGKRVFGGGLAEIFENDRMTMVGLLKKLGLPTPDTQLIIGLDKLREYLKTHNDLFIKVDPFLRGDCESFYHKDYASSREELDKIAVALGAGQDWEKFIVQKHIIGIETGIDSFVVNGQFGSPCMYGIEQKGSGYAGTVRPYNEVPEQIRIINDKLAPYFKSFNSCCPFSTEIIVDKDGKSHLIDPTVRFAMPVGSALQIQWYKNLAQFIWEAAGGNLIPLEPIAKYGAGVCLDSDHANETSLYVEIKDKSIRPFVKFRMMMMNGDNYYAVKGFSSICSVIGFGNTIDEAIKQVKDRVDKVSAIELDHDTSGLDSVLEEIKKMQNQGMDF